MSDRNDPQAWRDVDRWFSEQLGAQDDAHAALEAVLAENEAQGLPPWDVSPNQGRFLMLLARMAGARRVLEIGTLGGYSTIWLARAVGAAGKVVSLEVDAHRAAVARKNVQSALVSDLVDIRVGPAVATLEAMIASGEAPFDFFFVDAGKKNNRTYFEAAVRLSRAGSIIVIDNVVRGGAVLDPQSTDESVVGTRALVEALAHEPRVTAAALQTVGVKGWDGFVLARVEGTPHAQ